MINCGRISHSVKLTLCLQFIMIGTMWAAMEDWSPEDRVFVYYLTGNCTPENYKELIAPEFAYFPPDEHKNTFSHIEQDLKIDPWLKISLEPLFITSMSMKNMEFTVDMKLFITWEDPRILAPPPEAENIIKEIFLLKWIKKIPWLPVKVKLWLPDIEFGNSKGEKKNNIIEKEQPLPQISIRFNPWIRRIEADYEFSRNFFCAYDFKKYPFDEQHCKIEMNFAHPKTSRMKWMIATNIPDVSKIPVPPEYKVVSVSLVNCPNTTNREHYLVECKEYIFTVKRIYAQHVMLFFVPSSLIVSLSWISFWLDESAAPPRVALGLTTLLTLATQFNMAQKDLPQVADIKALDVWMFACMIMVFLSLVEFAIANYGFRQWQKSKSEPKKVKEPKIEAPLITEIPPDTEEMKQLKLQNPKYVYCIPKDHKVAIDNYIKETVEINEKKKGPMKWFLGINLYKIDRLSRIIFPIAYFIFNMFFWSCYTT